MKWISWRQSETLFSWCFEPSQPQRITSGLNTNFTLSAGYSFHKSSYHKSSFLSLFIFRGHSTREPASNRLTYFILRAYTGTSVSQSQRRKKLGEVLEKMQVNGLKRVWHQMLVVGRWGWKLLHCSITVHWHTLYLYIYLFIPLICKAIYTVQLLKNLFVSLSLSVFLSVSVSDPPPEGRPGMSDVSPLSGISGLSFDPTLLSALLFFCLVLLPFLSPDVILCGWLGLKHQLTN